MMDKTIFILREVAWAYYDEPWLAYLGANGIYKKFSTYQEALAEKNRLEIDIVRHDYVESEFGCNANFWNVDYLSIAIQKGVYDYFKDNFGIDWKGIKESGLVDKSKISEWEFRDLANNFIRAKVLRDDKHILYVLDMIGLNFYEISEVKESDCFYKLFTNINFSDFNFYDYYDYHRENPIPMGEEVPNTRGEFSLAPSYFYYSILQEVQNLVISHTYYELTYEGEPKNYLKGTLSDLSEAPEILKSYIENYTEYFVYDAENQTLGMNRIYDKEAMYEIMRGFVALLRPEKVPFIIKSFPISEIPEKYLA